MYASKLAAAALNHRHVGFRLGVLKGQGLFLPNESPGWDQAFQMKAKQLHDRRMQRRFGHFFQQCAPDEFHVGRDETGADPSVVFLDTHRMSARADGGILKDRGHRGRITCTRREAIMPETPPAVGAELWIAGACSRSGVWPFSS